MRYLPLVLLGCLDGAVECELFCETPQCTITLCTVRHAGTPTEAWFEVGDGPAFGCDGTDCTAAQQEALNHCGPCGAHHISQPSRQSD